MTNRKGTGWKTERLLLYTDDTQDCPQLTRYVYIHNFLFFMY